MISTTVASVNEIFCKQMAEAQCGHPNTHTGHKLEIMGNRRENNSRDMDSIQNLRSISSALLPGSAMHCSNRRTKRNEKAKLIHMMP